MSSPLPRRATSDPTWPSPTTPSVLPRTSTPMNFERFHSPFLSDAFASGMCRASASISPIACSAAEIVLPSGALTTITPRSVAALRSMLSTPTPARPTACSCLPAANTSAVTRVSLRTTSAWYPGTTAISSSGDMPVRTSTSASRLRMSMPSWAMGSATRIFFIQPQRIGARFYGVGNAPPAPAVHTQPPCVTEKWMRHRLGPPHPSTVRRREMDRSRPRLPLRRSQSRRRRQPDRGASRRGRAPNHRASPRNGSQPPPAAPPAKPDRGASCHGRAPNHGASPRSGSQPPPAAHPAVTESPQETAGSRRIVSRPCTKPPCGAKKWIAAAPGCPPAVAESPQETAGSRRLVSPLPSWGRGRGLGNEGARPAAAPPSSVASSPVLARRGARRRETHARQRELQRVEARPQVRLRHVAQVADAEDLARQRRPGRRPARCCTPSASSCSAPGHRRRPARAPPSPCSTRRPRRRAA